MHEGCIDPYLNLILEMSNIAKNYSFTISKQKLNCTHHVTILIEVHNCVKVGL